MKNNNALHASARFGLGPDPTEMKMIGSDPKGWLSNQISQAHIPHELLDLQDNKATETLYLNYEDAQRKNKEAKLKSEEAKLKNNDSNPKNDEATKKNEDTTQKKDAVKPPVANVQKMLRDVFMRQNSMRFLTQIESQQPFIERMVLFWSNHFTVSISKPRIMGLVNPYEVQAIRPHITGRFADMLIAVIQHPAMLIYLDNVSSIGPHSKAGIKRDKSFNENLGREILELHTLGVNGGYTQEDVIALANIITGWTLARENKNVVMRFSFQPNMHEPGSKILLHKTYQEEGIEEGIKALNDLARHPATAKHIATKLARHFISDEPPQKAIDKLAHTFLKTDGDLAAVYHTLIGLKQAWEKPLEKFKNSYEFVISALRLHEVKIQDKQINQTLRAINIIPFSAPSPAGYPDSNVYWSGADMMMKRIEWSRLISQKIQDQVNALPLAQDMFGSLLHEETSSIIAGAPSPQDAFAFLLASPEFQRR